ncbi:hypothetical protein BC629DRAFT_1125756 [Irpex lacteus]|nr:hypothetical protein BC629DRAFT_1125756 [Irpex lacteus]
MAPARSSGRRARTKRKAQNAPPQEPVTVPDVDELASQYDQLFLDPMSGQPLQLYIDKDVEGKDHIAQLITRHGGIVSPGYSGVLYVLVNPHRESGQNLYRQYAGKKNKIVVDASWVQHCVNDKTLHGFATNWAGCKVTGKEQVYTAADPAPGPSAFPAAPAASSQQSGVFASTSTQTVFQAQPSLSPAVHPPQMQAAPIHHIHPPLRPSDVQSAPIPAGVQSSAVAPAQTLHGHPMPITASSHDPLAATHSQHQPQPTQAPTTAHQAPFTYPPPPMHPEASAPPQTWQANSGIAPQQTHIAPPPPYRPPQDYREWGYQTQPQPPPPPPAASTSQHAQHAGPPPPVVDYQAHPGYDYGYRDRDPGWVDGAAEYYTQQYGPSNQYAGYPPPPPPPGPAAAPAPTEPEPVPDTRPSEQPTADEQARGRRRTRQLQPGAPPATTLVANRRNPVTRSPTPPTRVIKSTYGGNLFTVDDVMYLKKYIDYCQEQGLVLSLREICERIAIKAPHHTFYSWRRYCNKHQIRLGGYAMEIDHDELPPQPPPPTAGVVPGSIAAARRAAAADAQRTRSPTPPRALYRSTTGKGVAFTEEDVTFLVRFLEYRSRMGNGKVDMVAFWKNVAEKAPHHSRASWMKFYRRHKHELYHEDGDDPLPQPPEKKMRYSKGDDILLAKHFASRREGTSDKIFQEFARLYPHHPWKGWQEHHRIHKAKIDHLIGKLNQGQSIDEEGEGE